MANFSKTLNSFLYWRFKECCEGYHRKSNGHQYAIWYRCSMEISWWSAKKFCSKYEVGLCKDARRCKYLSVFIIPQLYIWFIYFPWDVSFHDLFDQELRIGKNIDLCCLFWFVGTIFFFNPQLMIKSLIFLKLKRFFYSTLCVFFMTSYPV